MKKKLMIIDDDLGITAVLRHIAEDQGYEVSTINDSKVAVAACATFQPDVLLLDMIMPDKDGIDILNEVLSQQRIDRLVLMSGFGDSYLRLARGVAVLHEARSVSVLRKPFRRRDLIALLDPVAASCDAG